MIYSRGQKILLLPDVHQEVYKARKIIKREAADRIVSFGDFFDSFVYDDNKYVLAACDLANEIAGNPSNVVLHSNHGVSYMYPSRHTLCSGWEERKQRLIDEHLDKRLFPEYKWHVFVDDFLCTHAGLASYFLKPYFNVTKENVDEFLHEQAKEANIKIKTGQPHWFYSVGYCRGGNSKVGGLVWNDWNWEFKPIEEIKQIVGHTTHNRVRELKGNYCFDCHLNYWATFTNGKLEFKSYEDL